MLSNANKLEPQVGNRVLQIKEGIHKIKNEFRKNENIVQNVIVEAKKNAKRDDR